MRTDTSFTGSTQPAGVGSSTVWVRVSTSARRKQPISASESMVLPLPPAKESLHPRTPLGRTGTSSRLTGTAPFSRSNHSATRASLLLLLLPLLLSDLVCDLHLGYNPGAEISSCSGAYS